MNSWSNFNYLILPIAEVIEFTIPTILIITFHPFHHHFIRIFQVPIQSISRLKNFHLHFIPTLSSVPIEWFAVIPKDWNLVLKFTSKVIRSRRSQFAPFHANVGLSSSSPFRVILKDCKRFEINFHLVFAGNFLNCSLAYHTRAELSTSQ